MPPDPSSTEKPSRFRSSTYQAADWYSRQAVSPKSKMVRVQVESSRASYEGDARAYAEKVLATARDKAAAAGVSVETHHKWHDSPYQAIIETAVDKGCDLIAMASHGRRGMAAVVMGSQATKLLTHSKIPVLVYR